MDAVQKAKLVAAGINVEEGVTRFLGKEGMFLKFLGMFCQDENYEKLQKAVKQEDWNEAVKASHSLKGLCGNLSMTPLYRLFT